MNSRQPSTPVLLTRELCGAAVLYAVLTMVMAYPLSMMANRAVSVDVPDTHLYIWTLAWDVHAFVHQPLSIFDANIFYPKHDTLAYSENLIGSALFAAPILWITGNPVLALNAVSLLSCVLCGVGAYVLGRRIGMTGAAAALAGIVFAFSPPRFLRFNQTHLTAVQWIPFALASLHQYLDNGRRRDLLLATGFTTLQILSSGHGGVFLILAILLLAAYRLVLGQPILLVRRLRDFGLAGALLLTPAVLVLLPYRRAQAEEVALRRALDGWDTPIESFLASPTRVDVFLQSLLTKRHINEAAGAWLFPGVLPVLLALVAVTAGLITLVHERRHCLSTNSESIAARATATRLIGPAVVTSVLVWTLLTFASGFLRAGDGLSISRPGKNTVIYAGYLSVLRSGSYTYAVGGEQRCRVVVDNLQVYERAGTAPARSSDRSVQLTSGPHRVLVECIRDGAEVPLDWQWRRAGDSAGYRPVPEWMLSSRPAATVMGVGALIVRRARPAAAFVSALALVTAAARFIARRRRRWFEQGARHHGHAMLFYVLLTVVSVALALGPPYGLWQFVYWLPVLNFIRASARFMILGVLAVAVLAGIGADWLIRQLHGPGRGAAALALGALLVAEFWLVPFTGVPFRLDVPAADRWVARQPGSFAIAEVPVEPFERYQTTYMLHSTIHWQKTVHGYSGIRPTMHDELYRQLRGFPSDASVGALTRLGIKYVVVHASQFSPEQRRSVEARLPTFHQLELEYTDPDSSVYSIRR